MKIKDRIIARLAVTSIVILVMAWCGLLTQATSALADSPAEVEVVLNAPDEVSPDSDFTVTVDISQVENFDSASYHVSFDATVLRLDNVTSGQIGFTAIPVDFPRSVDIPRINNSGKCIISIC